MYTLGKERHNIGTFIRKRKKKTTKQKEAKRRTNLPDTATNAVRARRPSQLSLLLSSTCLCVRTHATLHVRSAQRGQVYRATAQVHTPQGSAATAAAAAAALAAAAAAAAVAAAASGAVTAAGALI
jgi:hypothetical protein